MITWEQFQAQRKEAQEEVIREFGRRINTGHRHNAPFLIDLDVINVITLWNQLPFTYTLGSCSGTPRDHCATTWQDGSYERRSPFGYIKSHIYPVHPLSSDFRDKLETIRGLEVVVRRVHEQKELDGLHCLKIAFRVPEELVRTNSDLDYLNRCWGRLEEFLTHYHNEKRQEFDALP